jgi:hypothetical protein
VSALTLDDELELYAVAAVLCQAVHATGCAFCEARALLRAPALPAIVQQAHLGYWMQTFTARRGRATR